MCNNFYNFTLPQAQIATVPANPADSCKLFVFDTNASRITHDHFYNLHNHVPNDSLLILNNTRVAPARITLYKQTGGKVIFLFLLNEQADAQYVNVLVDRKVQVGDVISTEQNQVVGVIASHIQESKFCLKLNIGLDMLYKILESHGQMPIPTYLKATSQTQAELKSTYQTVFADKRSSNLASVAAPTASLHFTQKVFDNLKNIKTKLDYLRLEVGLGTFAPVTQQNIDSKTLHTEWFTVPADTYANILDFKKSQNKIGSVGTTALRALESMAGTPNFEPQKYYPTDIFITPGHKFTYPDFLITNFHLPGSSLMMLVEAFLRHKQSSKHLVELYAEAINQNYMFYSFGDAMLII